MQTNSVPHDGMTLKDRVKKLRKENHYSQVELAKELNVSQSVISLIESGNASISLEILKKLAVLFDKSCDWLIYGKDTYVKLSLGNEFIPLVKTQAKSKYVANCNKQGFTETLDLYRLPGIGKGESRLFEVEGDSMAPIVYNQDMVVAERVSDPEQLVEGNLYVFVLNKDIVIKRYYQSTNGDGGYVLKSDNSTYKDITANANAIKEIWLIRSRITQSLSSADQAPSKIESVETEIQSINDKLGILLEKVM